MNPSKSRLLCWSRNKTHNLLSVPGVNSDEGGRGHQAQTPPPQQRNWLFFLTLHFLLFSVFDFQGVCWTRLCLIRLSIWNVFVPLPPHILYRPCSRHALWAHTAPGVRKSPDQASGLLKFILESTVQTSVNKSRKIKISAVKLEAWKKKFPRIETSCDSRTQTWPSQILSAVYWFFKMSGWDAATSHFVLFSDQKIT